MNYLVPRPWDSVSYALVCIVSLFMAVVIFFFISAHCEWVEESTGIPGACGLGIWWIVFSILFLAIAAYAGRELFLLLRERQES